jgi:hypothetical protein
MITQMAEQHTASAIVFRLLNFFFKKENLFMATAKRSVYLFCYLLAAVFLLVYAAVTMGSLHSLAGWLLLLFFVSLAIAFRGNKLLRGLSYTVIILGVVSLAMYYPQYFKTIGDFKLSALIVPLQSYGITHRYFQQKTMVSFPALPVVQAVTTTKVKTDSMMPDAE